jgi:hypothetical protein
LFPSGVFIFMFYIIYVFEYDNHFSVQHFLCPTFLFVGENFTG